MHIIKWTSLLLLVLAGTLSACQRTSKSEPLHFGTERYDSSALHVALMPNRDCLPVYYAERAGIYERLGLKVQIASCASQMDCDTMLLGRTADGGWADRVRLAAYGKRAANLQSLWEGTQRWGLYVCGTLRVKDIQGLKGRTVGIARTSAENSLLDRFLKAEKMGADDVFRPQINDLKLRAQMLTGDQIDAAMLAWPYASLARSQGHRLLQVQASADGNACFVVKADRWKSEEAKRKWELFEKGRRMAMDSLRIQGAGAYSLILQKDYGLPKAVADTIKY